MGTSFEAPAQSGGAPLPASLHASQGGPLEDPGIRPPRPPLLLEAATLLLRMAEFLTLFIISMAILAVLGIPLQLAGGGDYVNATLIAAIAYAGLAELSGAYDVDIRFSVRQAWSRLLTTWLATSMLMLTLSFFLQSSGNYSRLWALSWFTLGGTGLCLVRAVAVAWMRNLRRQGVFNQRAAIFGAGPQGERLARYIMGNSNLTISLVGFFDDRGDGRRPTGDLSLPMRGGMRDLIGLIRKGSIDQVIVALPWSAEDRLKEVVAALAVTPIRIRLAPDLANFAFAHRPMVLLGNLPVLTLFERPLSGFDQLLKRGEDVVLGTLLLLIASPVLLMAAVAIKLDSDGPLFFRQAREGFNNQHFRIWKFRTMYADASRIGAGAVTQARQGDPRVTRVGRILRRTSIDELPQLFNVLQGDMSIVGPRPHAPSTKAGERLFSDVVATYAARHNVKPGITGWAQVSGWRGETDTEEKLLRRLEYDLHYIENWSLLFDLYIIVRTAATTLFQKAY